MLSAFCRKEGHVLYTGIAGIEVHKKMLAVVIADVVAEGEYTF
jgi:hypothetical protein